jgi:hypothetical protein
MMGVEKFSNADDARDALWVAKPTLAVIDRIRIHWQRCSQLAPTQHPLGVRKFQCVEEAQLERDETQKANALRLRELRK